MDQPPVAAHGAKCAAGQSDLNPIAESLYSKPMLAALSIQDIILIDRLDLYFSPGLSVLTGETGAGKSILLDAFTLAIGGRGDAGLVRAGALRGQVTARFELPRSHNIHDMLSANGLESGEELILRRIQQADGRSRAFINDQPVSVQLLRAVGAALVEIHGQHDDRALVDAGAHRALLDAYGGLGDQAQAVRRAWDDWRAFLTRIAEHEAMLALARQNADYLQHTLAELDELAPQPGEEDELAARRQHMMSAEKTVAELDAVYEHIAGSQGAETQLGGALRRLERKGAASEALLSPIIEALERALVETGEARAVIERALQACEFSQSELEQTEERLFALRTLARKHRVAVDELPGLQTRFAALLGELAQGETSLSALRAQGQQAEAEYYRQAEALSAARTSAAARLDTAVAQELAPLKLERAQFMTRLEPLGPDQHGPGGLERVSFHVRTNPGTEPGPMIKVASGGELSRFILALKVALAERGSAPTLIFDEIDTGVGGATAAAIGERLARLAARVQVISVTHAPQVAAHADCHLRISKQPTADHRGETMVTRVAALDEVSRHEEIARMLAGATITDEARAAARRLTGSRA
jgi:DNA repair protein RecN (Recombination protein N)